eukprot:CAMPEP_0184662848 /NCGR_PEP_ID=MMETSP0308-20130426/45205_1 /TAXON_ID=38269 /ORGANISM="Gloeochaete witrockiana, Strain SAG 46.84" /LENGTH=417 /DNA_ID=CAMNT_0027105139 /DNA_START=44 /DNA_END=1293 /DNA_ORIENTATION=-
MQILSFIIDPILARKWNTNLASWDMVECLDGGNYVCRGLYKTFLNVYQELVTVENISSTADGCLIDANVSIEYPSGLEDLYREGQVIRSQSFGTAFIIRPHTHTHTHTHATQVQSQVDSAASAGAVVEFWSRRRQMSRSYNPLQTALHKRFYKRLYGKLVSGMVHVCEQTSLSHLPQLYSDDDLAFLVKSPEFSTALRTASRPEDMLCLLVPAAADATANAIVTPIATPTNNHAAADESERSPPFPKAASDEERAAGEREAAPPLPPICSAAYLAAAEQDQLRYRHLLSAFPLPLSSSFHPSTAAPSTPATILSSPATPVATLAPIDSTSAAALVASSSSSSSSKPTNSTNSVSLLPQRRAGAGPPSKFLAASASMSLASPSDHPHKHHHPHHHQAPHSQRKRQRTDTETFEAFSFP